MTPGYRRRPSGDYRSCDVQELRLVASDGYDAADLGEKGVILSPGRAVFQPHCRGSEGCGGSGLAAEPRAAGPGMRRSRYSIAYDRSIV
jgi:hypothetical protein